MTFLTRNALNPIGATDNYFTSVSDYGDVTAYWHGVDAQVSARLASRLFVQLGASGGRGVRDYCAVAAKLPEMYTTAGAMFVNQQLGQCAISEDWLTSIRGLASYTMPKIDVLVSGTFRSTPGVAPAGDSVASNGNSLAANYNVSSANLQAQTGRPLAPGLAFQTVNLLPLGHISRRAQLTRHALRQEPEIRPDPDERGDRPLQPVQQQHRNGVQPDVRPGDQRRDVAGPTTVLNPRFARFNVTFNF